MDELLLPESALWPFLIFWGGVLFFSVCSAIRRIFK